MWDKCISSSSVYDVVRSRSTSSRSSCGFVAVTTRQPASRTADGAELGCWQQKSNSEIGFSCCTEYGEGKKERKEEIVWMHVREIGCMTLGKECCWNSFSMLCADVSLIVFQIPERGFSVFAPRHHAFFFFHTISIGWVSEHSACLRPDLKILLSSLSCVPIYQKMHWGERGGNMRKDIQCWSLFYIFIPMMLFKSVLSIHGFEERTIVVHSTIGISCVSIIWWVTNSKLEQCAWLAILGIPILACFFFELFYLPLLACCRFSPHAHLLV